MNETVKLEAISKIDEIQNFFYKELRLTKELMGTPLKSRRKSYHYVSGIVGLAYNRSINKDISDCHFDYKQAVLLKFWLSRISEIRSIASQQVKLGLVLEEKVTVPSKPKSDNRVEYGLGFSHELVRTFLIVAWNLVTPLWCLSSNAD